MEEYVEIYGTVGAVIYQNIENGYTVLKVYNEEGMHTVTGYIPFCSPGDNVDITGKIINHPSYGQQIVAESIERSLPNSVEGIQTFLSSGVIKGVGPAIANSIVNKFGEKSLQIINDYPERLAEIKGITLKKANEICKEFQQRECIRNLAEYLLSYHIPSVNSVKLYRRYGTKAMQVIRENPYILTEPDFDVSFIVVDDYAKSIGFDSEDSKRIEAAILFEMRYNLQNGHTFLDRNKLTDATAQFINVDPKTVEYGIDALYISGEVILQTVCSTEACYLRELYEAEEYVSQRLKQMTKVEYRIKTSVDKLIKQTEKEQKLIYTELQRQSVFLAATKQVFILTGGPGTGKTTSVNGIIQLYKKLGLKIALAAPTGRAAKRLTEVTGEDAKTIHRMLEMGYDSDTGVLAFKKNEKSLLDFDAIIVDETSMIDILLANSLLKAMKTGCRLILVGDADQLPSVGPGNFLSDLIRSNKIPMVNLEEIFRQSEESLIIKNSHLINNGEYPDLKENSKDFYFLKRSNGSSTAETIVDLVSKRLPNNMNIQPSDIQVISPTRKGNAGTHNLNKLLQKSLNAPLTGKKELSFGEIIFRNGDKVMQIKNNYDIIWRQSNSETIGVGLFNGEVGEIIDIDLNSDLMTIDFDGKYVEYPFDQLNELELSYAVTVHKAQGSEYKAVVMALSEIPSPLTTRGILYTGITRAKELLIIVGNEENFYKMVDNFKVKRRYSGLRARLCNEVR